MRNTIYIQMIIGLTAMVGISGCNLFTKVESEAMERHQQSSLSTIPSEQPGVLGVPGASIPTTEAVVARITNALENRAPPSQNSFATAITQFGANLPLTANPRKSSDGGATAMIAYAACADVDNTVAPYNIPAGEAVAAREVLIRAGIRIVNTCMGGLASQEPYAAKVRSEFDSLVRKIEAANTAEVSFNAVCVAATTYCALYRGF